MLSLLLFPYVSIADIMIIVMTSRMTGTMTTTKTKKMMWGDAEKGDEEDRKDEALNLKMFILIDRNGSWSGFWMALGIDLI